MKRLHTYWLYALLVTVLLNTAEVLAEQDILPDGFRFAGNYRFDKRVKIRDGDSLLIPSKPFYCRVYTDGISVRVYGESSKESYTSFTIHRNDGILAGAGSGKMETLPGVQAYSLVGNVLRQLTLTEDRLVLTKFPAFSDVVEITYANRRISLSGGR
ncbi:MAG: hypothetical protein CMP26_03870 [Roseibacillus sp.]|nr:hypothetical protein [Roseibacillus sp.]|tara:strand:- start:1187 stop:1657 length:471 start_codon:yes stop_codon:yes gene_type:complete